MYVINIFLYEKSYNVGNTLTFIVSICLGDSSMNNLYNLRYRFKAIDSTTYLGMKKYFFIYIKLVVLMLVLGEVWHDKLKLWHDKLKFDILTAWQVKVLTW